MPYKAPFMQVKLIMSINHAERASMRTGMLSKNDAPEIIKSTGFPIRASMAGIEVATAINRTKSKLVIALARDGKTGIIINPTPAKIKDEIIS